MRKRNKPNGTEAEIFRRQAEMCKAFAHPTRLHVLYLLGKGERTPSWLQAELAISKTNLSQHLAILKSCGVVVARREGKQIRFSLAMPEVKQACQLIRNVLRLQVRETSKLAG
jgi:DNA-binding transcriptional ArsR family regulator